MRRWTRTESSRRSARRRVPPACKTPSTGPGSCCGRPLPHSPRSFPGSPPRVPLPLPLTLSILGSSRASPRVSGGGPSGGGGDGTPDGRGHRPVLSRRASPLRGAAIRGEGSFPSSPETGRDDHTDDRRPPSRGADISFSIFSLRALPLSNIRQ